ncbi:ATP-binding protein [Streptomyces griseoaurantiacus]|uniref:ATP-binding protein n=1 Tax=Streptomyces griseoaurantiacus TaxID=68213 RepID=A0A7W2DR78_9ACTN|nr:ATP-binding protein [Streptomyces griseoaurantiacus]MBA5221252.1 ATP-binding protein [Streptomyces griseoaurantiacus]
MSTFESSRDFKLTVLGRTLEHLGTQMYKRRDVAIAELVANCWDAGATRVDITIPLPNEYAPELSEVLIQDDGIGMSDDEVEENYLVIGRNRRTEGQNAAKGRRIMGRKGVGKLAGFGFARKMQVLTWRNEQSCLFELSAKSLKAAPNKTREVTIPGQIGPKPSFAATQSGTRITMSNLKHKTPVDADSLTQAIGRRFSRTVLGEMEIYVNGVLVEEPDVEFESRYPEVDFIEEQLGDEHTIKWWAGFSAKVLPKELQGFTIQVNGKTAQAPPYFFDVEGTASGQHGTKYLTGVIEADYLDEESDDESDRVSTDRQEIDWDDSGSEALKRWGDETTRRLLRERVDARGAQIEHYVESQPEFSARISRLDQQSASRVRQFLNLLGRSGTDNDRVDPLAETIIRAFEYRQFHDFITELDAAAASADPDEFALVVTHMKDWRLLESRAVLEIIKGRLDIIDKFYDFIVNDTPETAKQKGRENLHDLIADYPWLINPEWQVLSEEKRITTQLREWGAADISDPEYAGRYDFIALAGDGELVVIEIKRSGHVVTTRDLFNLEEYATRLGRAQTVGYRAFISGDSYDIDESQRRMWESQPDRGLLTWREIHERIRSHYEHYRSVLEGSTEDSHFTRKTTEVARTKEVLQSGAYRGVDRRASGLGPQDLPYPDASQ